MVLKKLDTEIKRQLHLIIGNLFTLALISTAGGRNWLLGC